MINTQNIFNRDVYPTPENVLDMMNLDLEGKTIYEPHAGTGNIIKYAKKLGAGKIYFSEINDVLAKANKNNAIQVGMDFFNVMPEDIADVDVIVMNPPFSNFKKHILHAWEIAPDGCEVISLCNTDSIEKVFKNELYYLVNDYGVRFDLGNVFKNAERSTNVPISQIRLFKPIKTSSMNFDDYFDMTPDREIELPGGVVKYDIIDSYVNTYKALVKKSEQVFNEMEEMKNLASFVKLDISMEVNITYNKSSRTREQFLKKAQINLWKNIFDLFKLEQYVTEGVRKDLHKFIEKQSKFPFTKRNIFKMIEVIVGTKDNIIKKALIEAVDKFTMHYKENRYGVEGWVTNAGHLLNKKFILPNMVEVNYNGDLTFTYRGYREYVNDLIRVLCSITGNKFTDEMELTSVMKLERGEWMKEHYFFEMKGFKKGTVHFKFKDEKVWELLNRSYAQAKGNTLPEKI